jgi:hypothetical protein
MCHRVGYLSECFSHCWHSLDILATSSLFCFSDPWTDLCISVLCIDAELQMRKENVIHIELPNCIQWSVCAFSICPWGFLIMFSSSRIKPSHIHTVLCLISAVQIVPLPIFCGTEIQTQDLQRRGSISWVTSPVHSILIIFEMGSHKLFAQAGLEPWSSWC